MITTILVCYAPGCGASTRSSEEDWPVIVDRAGWRLVARPPSQYAAWGCPEHNGVGDAASDKEDLLTDYDPHPGLVARGVVSDEHDPESCEADCCAPDPVEETFYVLVHVKGQRRDAGNLRREIHKFFEDRPRIGGSDLIVGSDRMRSYYGTDERANFALLDDFFIGEMATSKRVTAQRALAARGGS